MVQKSRIRATNPYCQWCKKASNDLCPNCRMDPKADILPMIPMGSTMLWQHSWGFTRQLIRLRQNGYCYRCNKPLPSDYEVHHIKHREVGGSDHPHNLIALCLNCHKHTFSNWIEKKLLKEEEVKVNKQYWEKFL